MRRRRSRTLADLGRLPEAITTAEKGLAITEPLGDKTLIEKGLLYHALSFANYMLGDLDRAEEFTHKELAIMRQVKNFRTTANALSSLGEFERTRGNFAASIKYYDEALAIVRESDLKAAELMFTVNRCGALVGLDEHEKAERTIKPLVQKMRSTGHFMLAEALYTSAQANFVLGKMDEAKENALESLEISISSASPQITVCVWRILAKIAATTGQQLTINDQELTVDNCFDNAFAILDTGDMELEKAHTLRDRAAFELSRNQPQKAKDLDAAATEIFARLKNNSFLILILSNIFLYYPETDRCLFDCGCDFLLCFDMLGSIVSFG